VFCLETVAKGVFWPPAHYEKWACVRDAACCDLEGQLVLSATLSSRREPSRVHVSNTLISGLMNVQLRREEEKEGGERSGAILLLLIISVDI
jgi:hypothetical protein